MSISKNNFPKGFKASGISAQIKPSGAKDLSLIYSEEPAVAAAVFTNNLLKAAPVLVSQKYLSEKKGLGFRGVILSSGNANAATGQAGIDVCKAMQSQVAEALSEDSDSFLIAQTGLIGIPLDKGLASDGAKKIAESFSGNDSVSNWQACAEGMMTTDSYAKLSSRASLVEGVKVSSIGVAKGAAMLAPSMATMLAAIATDASLSPAAAQEILTEAMEASFHSMIVDGCTSTNDTVVLLANGASGAPQITDSSSPGYKELKEDVEAICRDLAKQMAKDGEGSTKFLTMKVKEAASITDARLAAKAVVGSLLIKCSLAGESQYWGRVLSELGASGATFDPSKAQIYYGEEKVCEAGLANKHDTTKVEMHMAGEDIVITAILGAGQYEAEAYGCDLTHAYVDENMGRS